MGEPESRIDAAAKLLSLDIPIKCKFKGNCMAPLVRDGDLATIVPPNRLRIGDIVVVSVQEVLVHRIVDFRGDSVITKADSSLDLDPPSPMEKVIGKVVAIKRDNRILHLDSRRWQIANYILARYSFVCNMLYRRLLKPKRAAYLVYGGLNLLRRLLLKLVIGWR